MRVLLAVVLLVAGCGVPAAPVATARSSRERVEDVRVDCMRDRGFTYTAFVPTFPPPDAQSLKQMQGDYAAMLALRKRYGYRVFSGMVYPDDREAGGTNTAVYDEANTSSAKRLNSTQSAAWQAASNACFAQAVRQVLHKSVTDEGDLADQMNQDLAREEARTLDTDPRLVALARSYAGCMRGKGYTFTSEAPSKVDGIEAERFLEQMHDLGRKQWGSKARAGENYWPNLTPEQARPYLDKEIVSALDDLECGKEFFPVYYPRRLAIWRQVRERWGH